MKKAVVLLLILIFTKSLVAQIIPAKKFQAKAPKTKPFGAAAFGKSNQTTIRWLGMSGFFINSRGTNIIIDPLTEWFDMPIMIDFPIASKNIPTIDALLATHSDNDHYNVPTCKALSKVAKVFHSTMYVDSLMKSDTLNSIGHNIGDVFKVKDITIKLTPADHAWQNAYPGASKRFFMPEDACGFWLETPDGSIWAPGDSKFMPEQLKFPTPDLILLDYSEDSLWHSGLEGSVKILNAYPNTPVILGHWGTVNAPDFTPYNGNPELLKKLVKNPKRILVLAPGEPFVLTRLKKSKK